MFSIRKNIPSTEEEIKSVEETQESHYPKSLQLQRKDEKSKRLTRVTFDPVTQSFSEEVLGVR